MSRTLKPPLCLIIALSVFAPPVLAGNLPEHRVQYQIDKQSLPNALTQFAEQTGLQILFRPEDIKNKDIGPFIGEFLPEKLLIRLLKGSALNFTTDGKSTVVIFKETQRKKKSSPTKSTQPIEALEELEVTGIRQSVLKNLSLKRRAYAQIDALSAEQISKFPDKNVADALQRIPGVSVDRIWGEGRDINIRGTDKDVNRTLMNGQNVASAYWWANDNPSRGFNYTILASELISSLAVYKSPEADIDEGSIGGTVIIYTRKPFDLDAKRLSITVEEQYSDLARQYDPQLSVLGVWQNEEQTFGLLGSFNWQNRSMRRDGLEAFPDNSLYDVTDENGITTEDVYVIWGGGSAIFQEERKRTTHNITAQWSPAASWDISLNYVNSSMDMRNNNQNYLFMPGGFKLRENPPVRVFEPRFGATGDGRLTLLGGEVQNQDSIGAALDAIFRDVFVQSEVKDLEFLYDTQLWELHGQLGRTTAEGGSHHDRLYRFTGNTREIFSLSDESIEISYPDLDPVDPISLPNFSADSRDWIRKMQDTEDYFQLDWQRDFSHLFFESLKTGIKFRDHTIQNERTTGEIDEDHPAWNSLQDIGLQYVSTGLTPRLHQQTATSGSLTRFSWADKQLVSQNIDPLLTSGLFNYQSDNDAFYRIQEAISAAYVKLNFNSNQWRGNFGLRIVNTQQEATAYLNAQDKTSQTRHYLDLLPSANLVAEFNQDLLWRTSFAKVMARPTFQNLSPNIVIDGTSGTASSGNPELKPYRAQQIDSGLEWYFRDSAILSATVFYKDISTFIYTKTSTENISGEPQNISRPYNAEGADIIGFEFQWQQSFTNGIGWINNYTYTNAKVPSADKLQTLELPGNSQDQVNSSLYFENNKITIRLSFNYRSKSFGELISGTQDETKAYQQWDFSSAYQMNDHLSIYFEGINLSNEAIYYRTANSIPQGLYEIGRRFSIGLRANY
ncbi:Ferripyoverdine receptor [Thalassocella blandensis]|nr:Ferripyoverdine receptor [Thalassocella blandensis]